MSAAAAASSRREPVSAPSAGFADHGFWDLDDDKVYLNGIQRLQHPETKNFVVCFGADEARVKFDVEGCQWPDLLKAERPARLGTRWINIFAPHLQDEAIDAIAKRYELSPRVQALMAAKPATPQVARAPSHRARRLRDRLRRPDDTKSFRASVDLAPDLEKQRDSLDDLDPADDVDQQLDLNHYKFADEIWHHAALDKGKRYLCIGYNILHGGSRLNWERIAEDEKDRDKPQGKRIWTWILLCDDKTVISMYEDPFICGRGSSQTSALDQHDRQGLVLACRQNVRNVFRQVSRAPSASAKQNEMMVLHIRSNSEPSTRGEPEQNYVQDNGASNLFFYLFDDWFSSFGLVVRKEHQYGAKLNALRTQMLERAKLDYIEELHHIGRQLAVLKRMFTSYKSIIDRVLNGQKFTSGLRTVNVAVADQAWMESSGGLENLRASLPSDGSTSVVPPAPDQTVRYKHTLGPTLTPMALSKFERLRDRIEIYVLTEISDCLGEKESLALMNFNLIALKDSQAVEHLTRVTVKLTILFLPVSLMTSYFSTQLQDVHYTLRTYWSAFGVIVGLSLFLLVVFSLVSGMMDSKIVNLPISRRLYLASKRLIWPKKAVSKTT
ncbi:MAG: hypothetical protein M1826_002180 [Phylliscum demangeonii]|nr:MAG: hypothetical protein M1826_002180 [Phylliscum demangeonii]